MTAINAIAAPSGAYLITDAAAYDADGVVTRLTSKAHIFHAQRMAIATSGAVINGEVLASEMDIFASFDDAVDRLASLIAGAWDLGAFDTGDVETSRLRVFLTGWSQRNNRAELYTISTDEEVGQEAFRLTKGTLFFAPSPTLEQFGQLGLLASNGRSISVGDPAKLLTKVIDFQRSMGWPIPGSDERRFTVGGSAVLTVITASGITQKTVRQWPDVVGELIDPAAQASQAGLSRLQRARMEKKARKGTLRVA